MRESPSIICLLCWRVPYIPRLHTINTTNNGKKLRTRNVFLIFYSCFAVPRTHTTKAHCFFPQQSLRPISFFVLIRTVCCRQLDDQIGRLGTYCCRWLAVIFPLFPFLLFVTHRLLFLWLLLFQKLSYIYLTNGWQAGKKKVNREMASLSSQVRPRTLGGHWWTTVNPKA